jgi:hypothetical protein
LWRFYVELGRLMEFLKRVIRDLGGSWWSFSWGSQLQPVEGTTE